MSLLKKLTHPTKWYFVGISLFVYDVLTTLLSFYLALYISYGCDANDIPAVSLEHWQSTMPFYIVACVLVFVVFRMYNCLWRLVSYYELFKFTFAAIFAGVLYYLISGVILDLPLPKRYYIIGGWIQLWFVLSCRFSYRFIVYVHVKLQEWTSDSDVLQSRAMLIGAGAAGQIILRDIITSGRSDVTIQCIIDDDPAKWHCRLSGVPVVGGSDDILLNVKKYKIEEILFAIPTISNAKKRDILNICKESGCKLRILPGIYSLVNGEVTLSSMRDVTIEELLGRDPIPVNSSGIREHISGKIVLVTGGGGSIGSELCRQIAKNEPKQLIIFEIYENNAYDIEQELRRAYPGLKLTVLIGSVRDTRRIRQVFRFFKPQIVFHAAAHKHVPLMEMSPCEAIKNNVLGTYKTAYAALLYGCERFVLISTDKAVNPTNIMGASKRICEMVVQSMNRLAETGELGLLPKFLSLHHDEYLEEDLKDQVIPEPKTEFVAVRFGNVLGSNGSVIPLFRKQIANGGPVTVTHPDIIRYFMTIPEAANLVLEAESFAKGGEIFILDMGEPVRIDELARNLIKLSGLTPDIDIKIEYSGLRPGEKLYEEKLMAEEGLKRTQNKLIHVAKPLDWDLQEFMTTLEALAKDAYENHANIFFHVKTLVPNFNHSNEDTPPDV